MRLLFSILYSLRASLLLVSIFCFQYTPAQKTKEEQLIDKQIETANTLHFEGNVKKLFSVSKKIIQKSEDMGYEKGLAYGNFYIASAFLYTRQFKESIKYINKAQIYTDYLKSDPVQDSRNYVILGHNYFNLNLYSLSYKNYRKAIDIASSVKNKDEKLWRAESSYYAALNILYRETGKQDSVYYYLKKEKNILDKLHDKNIYTAKTYSNVRFGNYFLTEKKPDSALYYYEKALSLLEGRNINISEEVYRGIGNVYEYEKDYEKAIGYYTQAVEISKKNNSWGLNITYKRLEMLYEKTGHYQKAKEYKELYEKINDSLEFKEKLERDFIVNELLKFEKEQHENRRKDDLKKAISIMIAIMILLMILSYYYKKSRDKNKKITTENQEIISRKEVENQNLKLKINLAFDEVIQLAKDNSPEFWARFQEVYPEFRNKILKLNPDLKKTELILLAYTYLGFNNKDVSEYTFKAIPTIKNNKSNLRKRLDIPAKTDFTVWLRNYLDDKQ